MFWRGFFCGMFVLVAVEVVSAISLYTFIDYVINDATR